MDLVFEGEARRVADTPTPEAIAALHREGGWPVQVDGDAFYFAVQRAQRRPAAVAPLAAYGLHRRADRAARHAHRTLYRGDAYSTLGGVATTAKPHPLPAATLGT